jgi:hypothetical protein
MFDNSKLWIYISQTQQHQPTRVAASFWPKCIPLITQTRVVRKSGDSDASLAR